MNFLREKVSVEELITTLVNFSYKGDVRMQLKMENPDKVSNLVKGNL